MLSISGKVYAKVLEKRFWSKNSPERSQGIPTCKRPTDQLTFDRESVLQGLWECGRLVFACLIDLKKAYDQFPLGRLRRVTSGLGRSLLRDLSGRRTRIAGITFSGQISQTFGAAVKSAEVS